MPENLKHIDYNLHSEEEINIENNSELGMDLGIDNSDINSNILSNDLSNDLTNDLSDELLSNHSESFKSEVEITEEKLEVPIEVIEAFSAGSQDAFKFIYRKFSQRILKFCYKVLNNDEIANDIMQEIFVKVYEKRNQFHGTNFKAWIYTIAKNQCINQLRKKRTFDELKEDLNLGYIPQNRDFSLQNLIESALAKLPIEYREVIVLKDYEDYNYNEISEILNIEVNLAKVRVFRARAALRKILEPFQKEINEFR